MKAHLIENGIVINTIVVNSLDDYPNLISTELGGNIGDFWDGNVFTTPSRYATLEEAVIAKLTELAAYRFERETAGITINGTTIKTDRESRALFHQIWNEAQVDPNVSIKWKGANKWITVGKTEIDAIKPILFAYIEECFAIESDHCTAIMALTSIAEVEAYDFTVGWPANE